MRTKIAGFGHYLPERRVMSAEIEHALSLPEGWIERRTGIRERRWAAEDQAVTDLAFHAAKAALDDAQLTPDAVGLVLLATSTPDHLLPPSAPLLAHRLGCVQAGAMDIAAACTGFVYALTLADSFTRVHGIPALVVAANILSRRINPVDRATSALFADAAGAVVVVPAAEDEECGLLAAHLSSQGAHYDLIKIDAGGSRKPLTDKTTIAERTMSIANGQTAFAAAIDSMVRTSRLALQRASLLVEDIDWWMPHQANARMIEAVRGELRIPREKTLYSLGDCGNSSAATIPLTLSRYQREYPLRRTQTSQTYLLTAVGAGFTEGAIVYRI